MSKGARVIEQNRDSIGEVVETTIRAGVLEDATAGLLRETGVAHRMDREGPSTGG